jgi:hypothetical protein
MSEYAVEQNKVVEMMNEVALAKRTAAMELLQKNFGQQKHILKMKGTLKKRKLNKSE